MLARSETSEDGEEGKNKKNDRSLKFFFFSGRYLGLAGRRWSRINVAGSKA